MQSEKEHNIFPPSVDREDTQPEHHHQVDQDAAARRSALLLMCHPLRHNEELCDKSIIFYHTVVLVVV